MLLACVIFTMVSDKSEYHQQQPTMNTFLYIYALSCAASGVAETVTYPLDITKTRLQIQGEKYARKVVAHPETPVIYRGFIKTGIGIAREEGILKLWQGITPAIYRHFVYSGCRMSFYEYIRANILKKNDDGSYPVWKGILGGLTAGSLAQFLASPTDLVKVQMQMEGRRRLEGKPPRVRNTWHAFTKIVKEGGIRGLWKGWAPNVQRAALVNMGDLTTYDKTKQMVLKHTKLKDNYVTHTIASGCSGLVSATLGTPADVVKSRMMNQLTDESGRALQYRSSLDCLQKTIQQEGFWALYKGFLPIWMRMAPWSLTFWLTYEKFRKLAGSSSF